MVGEEIRERVLQILMSINITARLAEQLHDVINGDAFHGQSMRELLDGVSAEQAMAKPVAGGHSIWETLLHIRVWHDLFAEACAGKPIPKWPFAIEKDWPPPSGKAADWERDAQSIFASGERLRKAFVTLGDAQLENIVHGRDYDFFLLLSGEIQHTIWHMGQILVLKRALGI
jgi:uncharacterized damage-inducible protein DinB